MRSSTLYRHVVKAHLILPVLESLREVVFNELPTNQS